MYHAALNACQFIWLLLPWEFALSWTSFWARNRVIYQTENKQVYIVVKRQRTQLLEILTPPLVRGMQVATKSPEHVGMESMECIAMEWNRMDAF